jgi:signal transduction histidine kinase
VNAKSLRLRLLLLGGIAIVLALALAGIGIASLFERHVQRRAEAELDTYIRQISAGVTFDAEGAAGFSQALADPRFEAPLSGLYWQIVDGASGRGLRSRSLWDDVLKLPADTLDVGSVHRHMLEGPGGKQLLVRERSISYATPAGARQLRIAVALDEGEIHAARAEFSRELLAALALLATALLTAAWAQIAIGLRPLASLKQAILAVQSGAKSHVEVIEPQEVMPLVSAVNTLLDTQTEAMESAKARAADLAHGLKTPLTVLMADAARLRAKGEPEIAGEIEDLAKLMRQHVDRELSRVRLQSLGLLRPGRASVEPVVSRLVATLARSPKGEALNWRIDIAENIEALIREDDLIEILGNLLDNACKWARSSVRIAASSNNAVTILVEDDGPGAPEALIQSLGQRGARLDQSVPGTGQGLAIAMDIAKAYGGFLTFETVKPHGFKATATFPKTQGLLSRAQRRKEEAAR